MIDDTILRFAITGWILEGFFLLAPMYLLHEHLISKRKTLIAIAYVLLTLAIGIGGIFFRERLRSTEYQILSLIFTLIIALTVIPQVWSTFQLKYVQDLNMVPPKAIELIKETMKKFKGKQLSESQMKGEILFKISAPYRTEYLADISIRGKTSSIITIILSPSNGVINMIRFFFVVTLYPVISVVAFLRFDVNIPFFEDPVNADYFFYTALLIGGLYIVLQNSVYNNFIYEFEATQQETLLELAKQVKIPKEKKETEGGINLNQEETLEDIRKRAEKIKEMDMKRQLEERQNAVRKRVEGVLGERVQEEKGIDPELVKKQLLITKIKTILRSTPITRKVKLNEIAEKVGEKDLETIEAIIIGLIDRNEVRGKYNIWDQEYYSDDTSSAFIEKTLEMMKLNSTDIKYIKVNKGGNIEIGFTPPNENGMELETLSIEHPTEAQDK